MKRLSMVTLSTFMLIAGLTACSAQKDTELTIKETSITETTTTTVVESSEAESESMPEETETVALTNWEGTWNNFYSYLEDPGVEEGYLILAEKEGVTADEVKQRYLEGKTYQCEIPAMTIRDNTLTIYSEKQHEAGSNTNVTSEAIYGFKGMVTDANDRSWACFETEDTDAQYQTFLLLPAEADVPGKTMIHFHFRYGNSSEELLAEDGWFATMIAYDTVENLIVGHMTYEEPALADWSGEWNNFYDYLENEGIQEAYTVLAEKEGNTADEVKSRYLEGKTYQCEIPAMTINQDSITFYSNALTETANDEQATGSYEYSYAGDVEDANGRIWSSFVTEDQNAQYKAFLMLPAEADVPNETMMHFHFRYGNSIEELLSEDGWFATMIAADTTDNLIIGHMTFDE